MYEVWRMRMGWHGAGPVETLNFSDFTDAVQRFVNHATSPLWSILPIGIYDTTTSTWLMLGKGWTKEGAEHVRVDHRHLVGPPHRPDDRGAQPAKEYRCSTSE